MSSISLGDLFWFCPSYGKLLKADQLGVDAYYLQGIEYELDLVETITNTRIEAAAKRLEKLFDHTRDVTIEVGKTLPFLKHIWHVHVHPKGFCDIVIFM